MPGLGWAQACRPPRTLGEECHLTGLASWGQASGCQRPVEWGHQVSDSDLPTLTPGAGSLARSPGLHGPGAVPPRPACRVGLAAAQCPRGPAARERGRPPCDSRVRRLEGPGLPWEPRGRSGSL